MSKWQYSFCWITDIHVGRADTYANDNPVPYVAPIANTGIAFTIDTGDCTETGTAQQYQDYNSLLTPIFETRGTLYRVPGNHDNNDWNINYDNWDLYFGGGRKFVFDRGRFRFIGFQSDTHGVPADQLTWLETQLSTLSGLTPLFFTHTPLYQITEDYANWTIVEGMEELYDMISTYTIPAYFAGHRHFLFQSAVSDGCRFINGACRSWTYNSNPTGYMLVDVFDDKLVINHYSNPVTQMTVLTLNI